MKLKKSDPEIYRAIKKEEERENSSLEMIASENYAPGDVMEATGSCLTDKYAEGYPGKRYYGGCENADKVESLAIERAKNLFKADHVNVQPHSGTQANIAAYLAVASPGASIMGMNLSCGGHLSHGHPLNFSGKNFKIIPYGVNEDDHLINYEKVKKTALEEKPDIIVAGASAYPAKIDFEKFAHIASQSGSVLIADIAHIAGLVAGGVHPDPVPHCDIVTTTTHKTLRGPRGGMIMCREKYARDIDRSVFPGTQGGPLMHVVAAKAVCFKNALKPEFKDYAASVVKNASVLASKLKEEGITLITGGTQTHLLLLDLRPLEITGKEAEELLQRCKIIANKNTIPYDPQSPFVTSGIRLGTPALTARGMGEKEMIKIGGHIASVLKKRDNASIKEASDEVEKLCKKFALKR
ncbi:MAG: serine hydroxymethyltransferase [Elusimicrobiota bacterium]